MTLMNYNLVSNCERHYLLNGIVGGKRLDGRRLLDRPQISLSCIFGLDIICINLYGSFIQLYYSYENTIISRGIEGSLKIFLDYSPSFILNNDTRKSIEIQASILRTLERILLDYNCSMSASIDNVEKRKDFSNITMNINIMNCDGFTFDSLCTALLILFNLYHKPSSVSMQKIIPYQIDAQRTSLSFSHIPYIFSFGIMENFVQAIYEPNIQEEVVINGKLVIGMNVQDEIMILKLSGPVSILPDQIYACCNNSSSNLPIYNELFNEPIKCLKKNILETPGINSELSSLFLTLESKVYYSIQQNLSLFTTLEYLLFNFTKYPLNEDSQLIFYVKNKLKECYSTNNGLQHSFAECSSLFRRVYDDVSKLQLEQIKVHRVLEELMSSSIERNDILSDKIIDLNNEKIMVIEELSSSKSKFFKEGERLRELEFLMQSLSHVGKSLNPNSSIQLSNGFEHNDPWPSNILSAVFNYITSHDYYYSQVQNLVLEFAISFHQKSLNLDALKLVNSALISMLCERNSFQGILNHIEITLVSARKELSELKNEITSLKETLLQLRKIYDKEQNLMKHSVPLNV